MVLVELPLPWPPSIEHHPLVADVGDADVAGRRHRLLGLAGALDPEDSRPDDGLRVVCYWRPVEAPFATFGRAEVCAPEADLTELVDHLVRADDDELAALPADAFAAGPGPADAPVRDLLICTHGRRDRCCGKLGTDLFRQVADSAPEGVRVWRTSHTGGHRFAPTGITFPDGQTWAGLDEPFTLGLLDRSAPAREAARRSRGSVGITDGAGQVADAAALAEVGWPWLDGARTVEVGPADGSGVPVLVDGDAGRYRVRVDTSRDVPVPPCGLPLTEATKIAVDCRLVSISSVP